MQITAIDRSEILDDRVTKPATELNLNWDATRLNLERNIAT